MQQNKVHFGICFLCKWRPESQALWSLQADSVNVRHDPVGHALAVLLPGQAVLPPAAALVTGLAVHKQDGEVNDVEIRQNVIKATRERPRQGHDEIAQVIGVANKAPPARDKKTFPSCSVNCF